LLNGCGDKAALQTRSLCLALRRQNQETRYGANGRDEAADKLPGALANAGALGFRTGFRSCRWTICPDLLSISASRENLVIHPTAIVHPSAQIAPSVKIGPYAIIDQEVQIGPGSSIGPYVYITGRTSIGSENRFFAGCVIGEAPQDLKYNNEPTGVKIGDRNIFREHVTVHRSNKSSEQTTIGSDNFFMQHAHVAHNVVVGNNTIIAGGALIAGHATIADRAFISGNCLVHQFTRVGTLALMQGGSAISRDLPPYTIVMQENILCGLNIVGLRRAGLAASERLELKRLYRILFRSGLNLRPALEAARREFTSAPAVEFLNFVAESKRGICVDSGAAARMEH
jgi:UDP-N-acetylglucosamine acyltransferase